MKRMFFIISLLLCLPLAAQQTYHARVVDGDSGEPLPYVSIYVGPNIGTLTNYEGDFSIAVPKDSILKISYVGYETQEIEATSLPSIVRMKPLVREMREVEIKASSMETILKNTIRQLKGDYAREKRRDAVYFFRSTMLPHGSFPELSEGFLVARCAVNLRKQEIISGVNYSSNPDTSRVVRGTNIFLLFNLGPRVNDVPFWQRGILPLKNYSTIMRYYDWTAHSILSREGERIYVIEMHYKNEIPEDLSHGPIIDGTLYVDSASNRLLRFDGRVPYVTQRVGLDRARAKLKMHVEYQYSNGFAEVKHLSVEGGNEYLIHRSLVFRLEGYSKRRRLLNRMDDLLNAVGTAGFDPSLWTLYDIIERTKTEDAIRKQGMRQISEEDAQGERAQSKRNEP